MRKNVSYGLIILCILCLGIIGCESFMARFTPADMPQESVIYSEITPEPATIVGVGTLRSAQNVKNKIIVKHRTVQLDLLRMAQDDTLAYQDAIGFIQQSIKAAQALQDLVIGSEGQPFSLLGLLAGFTGGAAIGKALKRKGDLDPTEVAAEVAKAKNGG